MERQIRDLRARLEDMETTKGVEPTQESSAILRLRRKLDMTKKRSLQKMPRQRG
jgi:hypothetical protein